jgi:hypothetical protein
MYRESISAAETRTEMHRFHHLTAALYFGIASLEAFLNRQMRSHLSPDLGDEAIYRKLRAPIIFVKKLHEWPKEILSSPLVIDENTRELLRLFNEIRGDLTHPKTSGRDIYERLDAVNAADIHMAVATYIVSFLAARGEDFRYWLFGWNYQNPGSRTQEIAIINNQQFLFSLSHLGVEVPTYDPTTSAAWQQRYMRSIEGFGEIKRVLDGFDYCEPKDPRFPYKPNLCRRWWTAEHQSPCGHASVQEIQAAIASDRERGSQ